MNLRAFSKHDTTWYHELATSSGDISRYVPGVVENDAFSTSELIRGFSLADFETEFDFVICNDAGTPVGAIFASQDPIYNSLSVAYFIGGSYRKQGYMTSALEEFISYTAGQSLTTIVLIST